MKCPSRRIPSRSISLTEAALRQSVVAMTRLSASEPKAKSITARAASVETAVLIFTREGVADFSDTWGRLDNQQRAIAGEIAAGFRFGRELKPLAGDSGAVAALLRDKFRRLGVRDRFP